MSSVVIAVPLCHHWREDIADMAEMGFTTFRFGTCWTRIFPTSLEDEPNQEGLAFYEAIVDELNAHGIAPLITICHDEMPMALVDKYNGWGGLISGFICCGWQGALWQVVCLAASFFIYLPFARSVDNELYENEQAAA